MKIPHIKIDSNYIFDSVFHVIFSFLLDHKLLGRLSRVSKHWNYQIGLLWEKYALERGLLEDFSFWKEYAQKDWKWIVKSKLVKTDKNYLNNS